MIDGNWVFGKNTGGWLKMAAYDMLGTKIENRHSGPHEDAPQVVTKEVWENAHKDGAYSAKNMYNCITGKVTGLKL